MVSRQTSDPIANKIQRLLVAMYNKETKAASRHMNLGHLSFEFLLAVCMASAIFFSVLSSLST
jgi:hypothetical protein